MEKDQSYESVIIPIDPKVKQTCQDFLTTHGWGNRGREDGTPEQRLFGLLSECMVYNYLFGHYQKITIGQDGGIDFHYKGLSVDVKSIGRDIWTQGYFTNSVYAMQMKSPAEIYIFCSVNRVQQSLEISGWCYSEYLKKHGEFIKKGTYCERKNGKSFTARQDNYFIRNYELIPIQELIDMRDPNENLNLF
jgi:hypothetical protein